MNTVLKGRIALTTILRPFWRLKFANVSNKKHVLWRHQERKITWRYITLLYNQMSNVNSSSFTTETNLFLFCKPDFLKLYWGSSILTNPSLDVLEYGVQHWTLLFSSFLYLFLLFKFSSLDNIFEYIVSFQKKYFHFSPYLVGRRNEKMDVKVVFLGKWLPISYAIFFNLGFRKSSSRMLFMPLRLYWCLQDLVTITANHASQDWNHVT